MQSDDSRDGKPLGAPLEGGGEAADDDLDSLAGSLGSIHPPDAAHEADDVDLKALSVLSSRSSTLSGVPEDTVLRLSGGPSPRDPVQALETASRPPAPAAPSAAPPRAALDAEPSRRNTWVGPLLVGLGLGVGAAGLAFGLASRQQPTGTAAAASPAESASASAAAVPGASVGSAPPVAAAPGTPPPPPVPEPSATAALAAVVGARPAASSRAPAEVARPAPEPDRAPIALRSSAPGADRRAPQATDAAPLRMGSPAPAAAAPAGPVLALRPVAEGPAPAAAPQQAAPQAGAKRGASVDELLDQALASPERAAALRQQQAAALEQDSLPETPSREAVTKAMTTMLPAISGCAMGHAGLATATIVVRGDGRVASAEVAGAPFAGSPSGRCMEGVIRRTAFPRFRQPVFRIKYPLSIQ